MSKMGLIKQIVPPELCFKCDVCCRFPESTSFLAPYFTGSEITAAVQYGVTAPDFLNKAGCKISLKSYEEAYICPAFDPMTAHCKIYSARPFDCVLYPFAIMLKDNNENKTPSPGPSPSFLKGGEGAKIIPPPQIGMAGGGQGEGELWGFSVKPGTKVVLGLDTKCPYVRENTGTDYVMDAAMAIANLIESSPFIDVITENLDLIGPFQDDVVPLIVLNNLSSRL